MAKLDRTTFESSRAGEYFDARQLSALTGVPQGEFASVCLKELVDNALDACETAGGSPEISIEAGDEEGAIRLTVSDNGPGIPPEVVRKVLDYNVRVSDKAAYRSPTRGAQGNALKTIVGIPYALGVRDPVIIRTRGVRHTIKPRIDAAGNVRISHDEQPDESNGSTGTSVSLRITPGYDAPEHYLQDFDPLHWARSFARSTPTRRSVTKVKAAVPRRPKFTNRPAMPPRSTCRPSRRARIGTARPPFRPSPSAT
ncbi:MAG: ATP-binding protein [Actinomycetota bacterium]|nr:ATP-binding protein [Actinomycetota bacterium]